MAGLQEALESTEEYLSMIILFANADISRKKSILKRPLIYIVQNVQVGMSHLDTQMQMHMRLFRAQRNFYIAGWVLISRPFFRTKFPQHRPCQVRPLPLPGDQAPSRLDQRQRWAPGMRDLTCLKSIRNIRSYLYMYKYYQISGGFGAENQIWLI